jgi:hypothetical protein
MTEAERENGDGITEYGGDGQLEEDELSDEEMLIIIKKAEENRQWVNDHREHLVERYPNQFVCVQSGEVVAAGTDLREMLKDLELAPDAICEYILPHGTAMIL